MANELLNSDSEACITLLDEYEQQIENEAEQYVPIDEETKQRLKRTAEQNQKRERNKPPHIPMHSSSN